MFPDSTICICTCEGRSSPPTAVCGGPSRPADSFSQEAFVLFSGRTREGEKNQRRFRVCLVRCPYTTRFPKTTVERLQEFLGVPIYRNLLFLFCLPCPSSQLARPSSTQRGRSIHIDKDATGIRARVCLGGLVGSTAYRP